MGIGLNVNWRKQSDIAKAIEKMAEKCNEVKVYQKGWFRKTTIIKGDVCSTSL